MLVKCLVLINGVILHDFFYWNSGIDYINFENKWAKIARKIGVADPVISIEYKEGIPLNF